MRFLISKEKKDIFTTLFTLIIYIYRVTHLNDETVETTQNYKNMTI